MRLLKQIWNKVYLFFKISRPIEERPKKKRKSRNNENVSFGQFTTIKSVLDSLDELFNDMKTLEPKGKEFQKLARKYGPYICSLFKKDILGHVIEDARLGSGFKAYGLPSFLINYLPSKWYKWEEDEAVSEFFVARKQTSLPFMKPKGHVFCYECCFVGLIKSDKKPMELHFNIVVHEDGGVEAYPYLAQIPRYGKKGRPMQGKMGLYYPDYSPTQKAGIEERKSFLVKLFCTNYNLVMARENGINIIVKKGKARATITVPPNRWKYFFKFREKVLTPSGRRKPIFHAVSSHHRHYQNGKVAPIKTHYRGARSFRWGEYSVKIILPGKHAPSQSTMTLTGDIIPDDMVKSGDWVELSGSETANKINKIFEGEI